MTKEMRWYEKNRETIAERRKRRVRWFTQYLDMLRKTQGCADCGTHDGRLDYHHIDPSTKKAKINTMAWSSLEAFLDELEKCTVLCRSCHKRRHDALAASRTARET